MTSTRSFMNGSGVAKYGKEWEERRNSSGWRNECEMWAILCSVPQLISFPQDLGEKGVLMFLMSNFCVLACVTVGLFIRDWELCRTAGSMQGGFVAGVAGKSRTVSSQQSLVQSDLIALLLPCVSLVGRHFLWPCEYSREFPVNLPQHRMFPFLFQTSCKAGKFSKVRSKMASEEGRQWNISVLVCHPQLPSMDGFGRGGQHSAPRLHCPEQIPKKWRFLCTLAALPSVLCVKVSLVQGKLISSSPCADKSHLQLKIAWLSKLSQLFCVLQCDVWPVLSNHLKCHDKDKKNPQKTNHMCRWCKTLHWNAEKKKKSQLFFFLA